MTRRALFTLTWLAGALLGQAIYSLSEDIIGKEHILEHWTDSSVTGPLAVLVLMAAGLLLAALGHRAAKEDESDEQWKGWR
jgi:hypothetical protein